MAGGLAPIPPPGANPQNYFSRNHHSLQLPNPNELASRIEEAQTSAKLLSQLVQSTPPSEFLDNELVREFSDRCQSASRSVQAYMVAENPAADNDTMETLIQTNEQLTKALAQHQRAILSARKIRGVAGTAVSGDQAPPGGPPPSASNPSKAPRKAVPIPPPGENIPNISDDDSPSDPFADPVSEGPVAVKKTNLPFPGDRAPIATGQFNDNLGVEPYHPGFKGTRDYAAQEDSSIGKATKHPGAPSDSDEAPISPESPSGKGIMPSKSDDSLYRY
jgi:hypothetical protein